MFSERLKELRKEKRLSQAQLAKELDVSDATVAMWEIDKRMPSIEIAVALGKFFDVSLDYLFCDAPMRERIPVDEFGFKIKTPPELEDVEVENVTKMNSEPLTPDELAAIRKMLGKS